MSPRMIVLVAVTGLIVIVAAWLLLFPPKGIWWWQCWACGD